MRRMRRVATIVIVLAFIIAGSAAPALASVSASTGAGFLGPPSSEVWGGYPFLGGYRHVGKPLRHGFRTEVLYFGTQVPDEQYDPSQLVSWPLIKALLQFGAFSALRSLPQTCGGAPFRMCTVGGYDLTVAYHSRYVSFVYHDLIDARGTCPALHAFTSTERALLHRYSIHLPAKHEPYCGNALVAPEGSRVPLLAVGGYAQDGMFITVRGDMALAPTSNDPNFIPGQSGLPADQIRAGLPSGKDPPGTTLVQHVNAEANLISALICHADGKQPKKACNRPAIKQILKHVK